MKSYYLSLEKPKAKHAFRDLVENLDVKYLAVSYNNTYKSKSKSSANKIKYEEILEILNSVGETQVFETFYDVKGKIYQSTVTYQISKNDNDIQRQKYFVVSEKHYFY